MSKIVSRDVVEKAPGETIERYFDFAGHPEVVAGETLTGSPTVAELGGSADLTITAITIDGSKVHCKIAGGLAKTKTATAPDVWRSDYKLRCTVNTNDSNVLILESTLRVESSIEVSS